MTDRTRARLRLSNTARDVADAARAMVPTYPDRNARPGDYIDAARRLRLAAERVIDAAAILEAEAGATTQELADRLSVPHDALAVRLTAARRAAATIDPGPATAELDRWYARTGEPGTPNDAVSVNLP